jgi:anti-sigma factor RsiW
VNESLHALSGAYVVDALDDIERAMFEKHLPGCLDCQREVASLREATALMSDDAAVTPPESLRDSVLAGIKSIRPLAPEAAGPSSPGQDVAGKPEEGSRDSSVDHVVVPLRRRGFRLGRLVAAAAAVAAIVGGAVYQPWQGEQNPPSATLGPADQVIAASDAQHYSINFKDGSSASVVRSPSEGKAVLLTRDMAPPPSGKAFELWLRTKDGVMKPAGMMKSGGDHKLLLQGDAVTATGVGITIEPESGSTTPSSAPIAMFELGKADA